MENSEIINIVEQLISDLVLIPKGSFLMGSSYEDKCACENEIPQHLIYIESFRISKFLVTRLQWRTISNLPEVEMKLNPHPSYHNPFCNRETEDNLPVEEISWGEALEFCNRLSIFTGLNITLPSESQWEYVCRAETTTRYYWGDDINFKLLNCNFISIKTTPIGSYPPNPWGLYDMCGNVEEWCLDDWHYSYENAPTDGSPWLYKNNSNLEERLKVRRGGAYNKSIINCRSASRNADEWLAGENIGFRICCNN